MAVHQGRTAVYRFFDSSDALIYIGITNNPPKRWALHAYQKPWWKDVALREVEWFDTREEAEVVEAQVISHCRPKWNIDGGEPERGKPGASAGHIQKGWEPDQHILDLVARYEQEQISLAQARDVLESEIVRIMRTGVSATRISKFLPFSTPMVQAIGKRAGVPLLRKATVRGLSKDA